MVSCESCTATAAISRSGTASIQTSARRILFSRSTACPAPMNLMASRAEEVDCVKTSCTSKVLCACHSRPSVLPTRPQPTMLSVVKRSPEDQVLSTNLAQTTLAIEAQT